MKPSADRNRATVRDAFTAWAAGAGDVFDLLADDARWTIAGSGPGAGTWHGRQAYIDAAVTPLFKRLGLQLDRVSFDLGDTRFPAAPPTHGSITTATVGAALHSRQAD